MLDLFAQASRRRPTRSFTSTLRHLGAAGLFFLAILDSSPIPTFGGPDILTAVLSAARHDLWLEYAACATPGSVAGAAERSVIGVYFTFRLAGKAGSAYLDAKFKKNKIGNFLTLFTRSGDGMV